MGEDTPLPKGHGLLSSISLGMCRGKPGATRAPVLSERQSRIQFNGKSLEF